MQPNVKKSPREQLFTALRLEKMFSFERCVKGAALSPMCSLLTTCVPPDFANLASAGTRCGVKTMGDIVPFLKDRSVFDPNDIQAMSTALADVCKSLNVGDEPQRVIIAERIIALAQRGVRSPTVLRDRVLYEAALSRQPAQSDGPSQTV